MKVSECERKSGRKHVGIIIENQDHIIALSSDNFFSLTKRMLLGPCCLVPGSRSLLPTFCFSNSIIVFKIRQGGPNGSIPSLCHPAKPGVLSSVKTKLIDCYKILRKPLCFEVVSPEAQGWLRHIFTSNGTTQVSPRIGYIN